MGARWFLLAAVAFGACHRDLVFNDLDTTCVVDTDCVLPSLHCSAGHCVVCASDAHCTAPGFPRCDASHRCVQCSASADCGTGGTCRSGRCATLCTAGCPASAPSCDDSICTQCDDGVGCSGSPAGAICLDHQCVACKDDTACGGATPRCDPVTHACVQCQQNADCPAAKPLCNIAVGTCVPIPVSS